MLGGLTNVASLKTGGTANIPKTTGILVCINGSRGCSAVYSITLTKITPINEDDLFNFQLSIDGNDIVFTCTDANTGRANNLSIKWLI